MRKSDIYDVSAELEREFGPVSSDSWEKAVQQAWDEYSAQILLDARKDAKKTQAEVAQEIGATKSYISRVEHGQIIPTVATFYRIIHACGRRVEIVPL
jgi:predicted transcriptional regulator